MKEVETIKNKIEELKVEIQKKIDFFNEIMNSISRLNNERDICRDAVKEMNGALSAYQQTVALLEGANQETADVTVIEAEVV